MVAPVSANQSIDEKAFFQAKPTNIQLKADFESWWAASKARNLEQIVAFNQQFHGHPLFPMGNYLTLLENLDSANQQAIVDFIKINPELGLSARLQQRYLESLANQQAWSNILDTQLTPSNQQQQCLTKQALLANQANQANQQIPLNDWQNFWLANLNLHSSCREIERHLHQQGVIDTDALIARLRLLFAQQRNNQIPSVIHLLPSQHKNWSQAWLNLVQQPNQIGNFDLNLIPEPLQADVAYTGLLALSRRDPETVLSLKKKPPFNHLLSHEQIINLQREAGLHLTYRYDEQGWQTLNQLGRNDLEEATLIWQARFAIRYNKWVELERLTAEMPETLANQSQWRYWRARALAELGDKAYLPLYEQLATERHYYGFLAADRLGKPYSINRSNDFAVQITEQRALELIDQYPSLQLISALVEIEWRINAHREWHHLLNIADPDDFADLAAIAHTWELHHLAITTLGQIQAWDALDKRFPTPYSELITHEAERHRLPASLIYSIMRRESAFYPHARSPAGAQGLMQLMPATARKTAQKQGITRFNPTDVFNIEINILLGSAYLGELINRYDHPVLAIAAYNAGPSRVNQWVANLNEMDNFEADQWIDTLPFMETRRYVRQVLEHKMVYDFMLTTRQQATVTDHSQADWLPPLRLSVLMRPIKQTTNLATQ